MGAIITLTVALASGPWTTIEASQNTSGHLPYPGRKGEAQMKRAEKIISILTLLLPMLVAAVCQAQQPLLQITAPASGTLATEGQTITITVSSDPSVQNLGVLVPYPLPEPQPTSASKQFTLTLPTTIPPGLYNLTAAGSNATGDVESAPVTIDVEPQSLGAISVTPTVLTLNSVGDQYPLRAISTFSSGTPPPLDVTYSTQLSYSSYNSQIATVNSSGMITAVAAGQTYILVQNIPEGGATVAVALVTVSQQPPTGTPPAITSVTPTSGIPAVTQVSVTGSGFGAAQGNGFVQLGTQNGTVSSWSDMQIVATVPAGSRSGVASVNQNRLYSNTVPFTISVPVIQGISPLSVTVGSQLTITGSGFGATQGNGGLVGTANTNGNVVSWSDSQIVISIAPGTMQGNVSVQQNGAHSNLVPFAMIPPVIASISPSQVAPGMQMTITGSGFGATQGNGFVGTANTNGNVVSWSDSQIVITIAPGTTQGNVTVQQYGVHSNSVPFTMIPPVISSISPSQVAPGMQMTITGTGFGATQGNAGLVLTANTNGNVVSWSDSQIVITIAPGTMQGNVSVEQNGVLSNSVPFTMIPPVISSISPSQVAPGMQMTITGTGFGATQGNAGLVLTANTNGNVVSWSDSQIVITIAPGTMQGNVSVEQNGVLSNSVPFTMIPPVISSISPSQVAPGMQMTITGTGFGATQGNGFVGTANTNGNVVSWSDSQIVITIAPGTTQGNVTVQQYGVYSNSVPFTL